MKRHIRYKKIRPSNLLALHLFTEGDKTLWASAVLDKPTQDLFKVVGKRYKIDMNQKQGYAELVLKLLDKYISDEEEVDKFILQEKLAMALEGNYDNITAD